MPRTRSPNVHEEPASSPLKRNQACHQCRKRKTKCDAGRPCSTCRRLRPASSNAQINCTYDDPDHPPPPPRAKYHRLESRITELEALLREPARPANSNPLPITSPPHSGSSLSQISHSPISTGIFSPRIQSPHHSNSLPFPLIPADVVSPRSTHSGSTFPGHPAIPTLPANIGLDHSCRNLPPRQVLTRLTQVFFDKCPQASIALHRPTFLAALRQPVQSPQFPHAAILHAICAVASLHEPIHSSSQPIESEWPSAPGLVPTSFSEKHARWAKEFHDEACFFGVRLSEIVTSIWILSQYYFSQARWFELWTSSALALRYAIPLGMHKGPSTTHSTSFSSAFDTFHIADFPSSPDSVLADPIEEERRRNTFWLCYAVERFQATSPHNATCLHDEDITQLLPLRVVDFEVGATHMQGRQTINSRNVLTEHPAHLTDSFVLYVKSAILLSRVKSFNARTVKYQQHGQVPPDFARMESTVNDFLESFPPEYQHPIVDGVIDPLLLIAHMVPHIALIQMHDPYTMSQIPEMRSTDRILTASRHIFQLTVDAYATQFDFALLDDTVSLFWYIAATSLMQFWKASAQFGDAPRAGAFSSEVEIIRLAMARLGKQVSVAQRHLKMLDDRIRAEIPQYPPMSSMASPLALSTVTSIHSHSAGTSPTDDHLSFDSHLQAAQDLVGFDTAVQGIVPADSHYEHLV